MAFRKTSKNLIADFETGHLRPDFGNSTGAVIANLVGEAIARTIREKNIIYQSDIARTYLSFNTAFDTPDAFFTSIGLILAAWTLITMS
jgi:hypothetical protein